MTAVGRLLPFTNATFWFDERPLIGESGHWDASSKSPIYDIRERQLRVESGRSSDDLMGNQVVGTAFALDVKFADEMGCGLRGGHGEKRNYADMCTSVLPKCYLNTGSLFTSG